MSIELSSARSRNWRDISQPVKPRAMSREGRRRVLLNFVRWTTVVAIFAGGSWSVWEAVRAMEPSARPASARKDDVVKDIRLITGGTLNKEWVLGALALPTNAPMMSLDLRALQQRVLAHGQVMHATVELAYPSTVVVRTTERPPVARLRVENDRGARDYLVARDGVVFPGVGFEAELIETLPWLDGVKLVPTARGFRPIAGMATVSDLLVKGQLEARHLYGSWHVVSLARLESDDIVEVRTKNNGLRVLFSTRQDYLRQVARLDWLIDHAGRDTNQVPSRVDLTNGDQVAVLLAPIQVAPLVGEESGRAAMFAVSARTPVFDAFPNLSNPPKTKREF